MDPISFLMFLIHICHQNREPLSGNGRFITQMLMGNDGARLYLWDSSRGVTAVDTKTLVDLYSIESTQNSS